jgi:preprotein translocase subunit YajC
MLFALHLLFAQGDGAAQQPGSSLFTFLPMILLMVFAYFLLLRPANRQRKEQQAMLASLKKNDKVITSGGLIGIVSGIKDDEVTLKVDDSSNVRLRVTKGSVVRVVREEEAAKEQKDGVAKSAS